MEDTRDEGNRLNPAGGSKRLLVWIGLGFALLIISAVLASNWATDTEVGTGTPEMLVSRGIVAPDEPVIVWADLSAEQNFAAGCLITMDDALRWEGRQVIARVPLRSATVALERTRVTIGDEVICDFVDPEAARAFAKEAARGAEAPRG